MIEIPPTVAAKARAVGSAHWLVELPHLIESLEREWGLTLGSAYPDATEAYVAPARLTDGTDAVLKLMMPREYEAADNEIEVLRLAGGDGCVALYRSDTERGALLLERLGPSLYDLKLPIEQRHEILCTVASRVWRPVPESNTLPTGADKAAWLAQFIPTLWERLDHPCSERAVQHALDCAERRRLAHDPERARLVHGDVHQWNTLQAGDGYKLVDPDGLHADPEYDLGIVMREDPVELLRDGPRNRSAWLADRTGTDETAIWEWGVVERVSTGLLGTSIDLQPFARQMLEAADAIAG